MLTPEDVVFINNQTTLITQKMDFLIGCILVFIAYIMIRDMYRWVTGLFVNHI